MYSSIKCKKCRCLIINEEDCKFLKNSHHFPVSQPKVNCSEEPVIFLNEDRIPAWIKEKIDKENWSKGRINCTQCDSRVGGFDFISGTKCNCSTFLLPPVHFIKSKVDLIKTSG